MRTVCARLLSADDPAARRGAIKGSRFAEELEALFDRVVGDRAGPYGYGSGT